jgi:hypothetical protein
MPISPEILQSIFDRADRAVMSGVSNCSISDCSVSKDTFDDIAMSFEHEGMWYDFTYAELLDGDVSEDGECLCVIKYGRNESIRFFVTRPVQILEEGMQLESDN